MQSRRQSDYDSMRSRSEKQQNSLSIRTDHHNVGMGAVLNSPTAGLFRNKLSSQIRRVLPLYLVLIVVVLIFTNVNFVTPPPDIRDGVVTNKHNMKDYHKTQDTRGGFPRKIWQTWKTHPLSFEQRDHDTARTWPEKNPHHRYEVLTDDNEMAYLDEHYGPMRLNRPDLIELYHSLTAQIIKADLLRYLIMYAEGGVYADIDVEDLRPISRFIPDRYSEDDIDMVLGIEVDQPDFRDHPILGIKSQSFCQWVFMCKPRIPVMLRLVESIKDWLEDLSKRQGKPISELHIDFDDVINGSGPSAFTKAVLAQMNTERDGKGKEITWDTFHDIPGDSKLVSGFLVLNVEAFAAGQGHSDSGNHDSRFAMVKHHYHASGWPSRHGRKLHPIYGEVERCNWNHDCVNEWDRNVAEFEALSQDEKDRRIAESAPPVELFMEQIASREQDLEYVDHRERLPEKKEEEHRDEDRRDDRREENREENREQQPEQRQENRDQQPAKDEGARQPQQQERKEGHIDDSQQGHRDEAQKPAEERPRDPNRSEPRGGGSQPEGAKLADSAAAPPPPSPEQAKGAPAAAEQAKGAPGVPAGVPAAAPDQKPIAPRPGEMKR